MKRRLVSILGVGAVLLFPFCIPANSGPLRDAAMAEVQRGIDLCPTGNLDGAMEIFKSIEVQFPEEKEAIGWARWWHANCLLAGWRLGEVTPLMAPVWGWVTAGEITSPTACFLFGHQYARVQDPSNVLRGICEKSLQFYDQLEDPGIQIEEKSGFLQVFLSRCYYRTREYAKAAAAGQAAWEKGEALRQTVEPQTAADLDVKPLVLAAWGRLEQAKAELRQGNVLLAQVFLTECVDEYSPRMEPNYTSEVETFQQVCRLELGMSEEVRSTVLQKLISTDESIDKGLWLRAAFHFANEAYNRGATEEAIAPMAVARTCYVAFPGWELHIDLLWQRKIRGHTPNELFIPELQKQMNEGGNLERAAIQIQLAEILAEEKRGAEGLVLLDEVPTLSTDPRLNMGLRVARAHCEFPGDAEAELRAYELELADDLRNSALAEHAVRAARACYWLRPPPDTSYVDWLDQNVDALPVDLYRLEKARWNRERMRNPSRAFEILNQIPSATSDYALDRLIERVVCKYDMRLDDEAFMLLSSSEFLQLREEEREQAHLLIAWKLQYDRPKVALSLLEEVLTSRFHLQWTQDALLCRARILTNHQQFHSAKDALLTLTSAQTGEVVGEGLLRLGFLLKSRFDDIDGARSTYQRILAASDEFVLVQERAGRAYASLEYNAGNTLAAIAVCDHTERNLPFFDVAGHGWLRLQRARYKIEAGFGQDGVDELEYLAAEYPDMSVRSAAQALLSKESQ